MTVIPPLADGTARRGCTLQNCKFTSSMEGDYENLSSGSPRSPRKHCGGQVTGGHRRRYERSFSPPRSSNSSGYGTGSSSKSFQDRFPVNNEVSIII